MKRTLVFLFLLIASISTFGQIEAIDTTAAGTEVIKQIGTFSDTDVMPLPVQVISGGLTGTLIIDSDSTLKVFITGDTTKYWDWSKYVHTANDTVASATDTLYKAIFGVAGSFSQYYTKWFAGDIIADDTIEVSYSGAFGVGLSYKVLPNILIPLPKTGIAYQSNIYIRRFKVSGETGSPAWIARVWGY